MQGVSIFDISRLCQFFFRQINWFSSEIDRDQTTVDQGDEAIGLKMKFLQVGKCGINIPANDAKEISGPADAVLQAGKRFHGQVIAGLGWIQAVNREQAPDIFSVKIPHEPFFDSDTDLILPGKGF